jgi:hypothetical protein
MQKPCGGLMKTTGDPMTAFFVAKPSLRKKSRTRDKENGRFRSRGRSSKN